MKGISREKRPRIVDSSGRRKRTCREKREAATNESNAECGIKKGRVSNSAFDSFVAAFF
jgi:hypothetical protein